MTPDHDTALADQVLAAAPHCTALPPHLLTDTQADPPPPDPAAHARQLAALRGALIVAAATVTDQLLDDTAALAAGQDIATTTQLAALPTRFAHHYTPAFARQFLVAFLDLTTRLTADQWTPPSCVAQELGVRLLLDQAHVIAALTALPLPPHWQDTLLDLLLEDLDHEYLYDPALDGFEDDPHFGPPGMTPMRIQDWFTPFPAHQPLPPYLT